MKLEYEVLEVVDRGSDNGGVWEIRTNRLRCKVCGCPHSITEAHLCNFLQLKKDIMVEMTKSLAGKYAESIIDELLKHSEVDRTPWEHWCTGPKLRRAR